MRKGEERVIKTKYKVIAISFIFGLLSWIFDAAIDYLVFYEGTFLGLLITDVPSHEVYIRLFIMAYFLIFGFIVSRVIVKREGAENALREKEQNFHDLVENLFDGVAITDENAYHIYTNPKFSEITGYSSDELLNMTGWDFTRPEDRAKLKERMKDRMAGKPVQTHYERIIIKKDGTEIPVKMSTTVTMWQGKKHPMAIIHDITEQKRAEDEIQHRVKEMTAIYDAAQKLQHIHTPDILAQELISILEQNLSYEFSAVLLIDESTDVLIPFALSDQGRGSKFIEKDKNYVSNQRFIVSQGITGWVAQNDQSVRLGDVRSDPRYKALRKDIRSEMCVPLHADGHVTGVINVETAKPDAYTESDQRVLETIASQIALAIQQSYLLERIERHSHDLEQRIREHTTELLGANKELKEKTKTLKKSQKSLALLLEDVNESRAKLDISNKKLEVSNKELEAFAYSVSHDLRAPLRAIDGFTRILIEDHASKLNKEGKRLGSIIQDNAKKMGNLIDDLLAFSRMGRAAMHFSDIDMKKLAKSIYYEATNAEERKQIKLIIGDIPRAEGDTTMIRQVWMNLISNAVKFSSKRKKAVISVSCQEEEDNLTYCIKDNGAGFNMKYKDKLFGVFQRLHSEKEFKGTGVGLALVQRIIHRHGGNVWAEGKVDNGAEFFFSLPKKGEPKNGS